MQISRLDKIIENNVMYSVQKANDAQIIFILQDISTTLAMIYDKMCGINQASDVSSSVTSSAYVIPYEEMKNFETMHFETNDYKDGYTVSFVRYEKDSVIVLAFGEEMKLKKSKYGKDWRCWNVAPKD